MTKGTKNFSCFRAICATQTSRAAIFSLSAGRMVLVIVVVSAVQKKRGHQRGVARDPEGQQLILSCLCVSILFSQATKWTVERYEILYPIRILDPMHEYIG